MSSDYNELLEDLRSERKDEIQEINTVFYNITCLSL